MTKLTKTKALTLSVSDNDKFSAVLTETNTLMIHKLDPQRKKGGYRTIQSSVVFDLGVNTIDDLMAALTWLKQECAEFYE